MKTYRNRLYSVPDAAKRAGITEKELRTLIFTNVIRCDRQFGSHSIWGGEIPKIKSEWEYFNKRGERYETEQKEKEEVK